MRQLTYTIWESLFDLDTPLTNALSWPELVAAFSTHERLHSKEDAGMFSPYLLRDLTTPCLKHRDGKPRSHAHRCDSCVVEFNLAVFDADEGSQADMDECERLLEEAGLARLWYTSYSYSETKQAWRLIIPLAEPVHAAVWKPVRAKLIRDFAIPADPQKCSGLSHAYFLPSCPPESEPHVLVGEGSPYIAPLLRSHPKHSLSCDLAFEWEPPPEPETPIDLAPFQESLRRKLNYYSRTDREKADLLQHLLAGEPLASHGDRNKSATRTAGILAYALPDAPLSVLQFIFRPSLNAMVSEGSRLTEDKVKRMLLTAMRCSAEHAAQKNAAVENARSELEAIRALARKRISGG